MIAFIFKSYKEQELFKMLLRAIPAFCIFKRFLGVKVAILLQQQICYEFTECMNQIFFFFKCLLQIKYAKHFLKSI